MTNTQRALSEAECAFAESHHHMVISYLRRRRLPESEFYDAVIDRYLRTVQLYCTEARLRRYKFKTILNKALDWAVKDYWRRLYNHAQRFVSLDTARDEHGTPLHEMLADAIVTDEQACGNMTADDLMQALSDSQQEAIRLRLDGFCLAEIAERLRLSMSEVESLFLDARAMLAAVS